MSERTFAELRRLKEAGGDPKQWIEPRTVWHCDWCRRIGDIRNSVCEECESRGRTRGSRSRVDRIGTLRTRVLLRRFVRQQWRNVLLFVALAGTVLALLMR